MTRQAKRIDGVPHQRCTGECGDWLPATAEYFYPESNKHNTRFPFRAECRMCAKVTARARNRAKTDLAAEYPERFDELVRYWLDRV